MHMHDEIAHVRVVDRLLRLCLPDRVGGGIIRIDADNIEAVQILELVAAEVPEFASKYQVK